MAGVSAPLHACEHFYLLTEQIEEIKEQMTQGNPDMKENVEKMMKKLKKSNKVKNKMPKTLEEKVKDLEKEFIPK